MYCQKDLRTTLNPNENPCRHPYRIKSPLEIDEVEIPALDFGQVLVELR